LMKMESNKDPNEGGRFVLRATAVERRKPLYVCRHSSTVCLES
jgi:hypothetical protein